jgi:hypothetical protein
MMPRLESLEGDRAKTNKESLNDTVHSAPVVKVVAIGVIGSEASALMIKEGIEGVGFVYYDNSPVSDESIKADLLDAHLVIVMGVIDDATLFGRVGHISKGINLLTIGIGVTGPEPCALTADLFDSLFLVSEDQLTNANQSASDFLNLAVAGLAGALLQEGRVCLDFRDVETVLTKSGGVAIGVGVGLGTDRAVHAVNAALAHPALVGLDPSLCRATWIILKANGRIPIAEIRLAMTRYQQWNYSPNTFGIYQLVEGGNFQDEIRATVLVTGLKGNYAMTDQQILQLAISTDTDELLKLIADDRLLLRHLRRIAKEFLSGRSLQTVNYLKALGQFQIFHLVKAYTQVNQTYRTDDISFTLYLLQHCRARTDWCSEQYHQILDWLCKTIINPDYLDTFVLIQAHLDSDTDTHVVNKAKENNFRLVLAKLLSGSHHSRISYDDSYYFLKPFSHKEVGAFVKVLVRVHGQLMGTSSIATSLIENWVKDLIWTLEYEKYELIEPLTDWVIKNRAGDTASFGYSDKSTVKNFMELKIDKEIEICRSKQMEIYRQIDKLKIKRLSYTDQTTKLIAAMKRKDVSTVKEAIENGAECYLTDSDGIVFQEKVDQFLRRVHVGQSRYSRFEEHQSDLIIKGLYGRTLIIGIIDSRSTNIDYGCVALTARYDPGFGSSQLYRFCEYPESQEIKHLFDQVNETTKLQLLPKEVSRRWRVIATPRLRTIDGNLRERAYNLMTDVLKTAESTDTARLLMSQFCSARKYHWEQFYGIFQAIVASSRSSFFASKRIDFEINGEYAKAFRADLTWFLKKNDLL